MIGLFFTGTDTGVGKTHVLAAVARHLRRQGRTVRVCKPVATGAERTVDGYVGEDTRQLARAVGEDEPGAWRRITEWTFAAAAAPPVAACVAGQTLYLPHIAAMVRRRWTPGAILLVEGIGGLLCPLTDRETVADLAATLGLPLVVVARRSLGTLNHTLLTVQAALARHLPVGGVVVSETTPGAGLAEETNVEELRRRLSVPVLAVASHGSDNCEWAAAVDWWRLAHRFQLPDA
jgi:dethiobiotin synthetase